MKRYKVIVLLLCLTLFAGILAGCGSHKKKEKSEAFDVFWDKYHETMQKPKQYVARAHREWDKLTKEEQRTAINHIEEVYYHTNDTRFIPLAATYLKDKAFLNEYID